MERGVSAPHPPEVIVPQDPRGLTKAAADGRPRASRRAKPHFGLRDQSPNDPPARRGLVDYTGHEQAISLLLGSLRPLEYRGYDSAGQPKVERGRQKDTCLSGAEA
jgi:hypothetical protein